MTDKDKSATLESMLAATLSARDKTTGEAAAFYDWEHRVGVSLRDTEGVNAALQFYRVAFMTEPSSAAAILDRQVLFLKHSMDQLEAEVTK